MTVIRLEDLPYYTYDEYKQWEGRWELIHGIPYAMSPSPTLKHQNISGSIHIELAKKLMACDNCVPVIATDWKLTEETVLCPDNAVVCHLDFDSSFLSQPPQIIFEVLSPSTKKKDRTQKYEIYQEQCVKYYVMVDSAGGLVEVYELCNGVYRLKLEAMDKCFQFDLDDCTFVFDFSVIVGCELREGSSV